jgi:hypothetical protein
VVIVGHGAGQFLTDLHSVVRVFVVAPMEERISRVVDEGSAADADAARRLIEQQDRESAEYLRYLFGIDWLDAHQWDLVINTGRASADAALEMLVQYTQSLIRDRSEHTDLRRQQLASRVEHALLGDDSLGVDRLNVQFVGEALVLQGEALAAEDRQRAESLARALAGDVAVENRIVLRPPTSA